MIEILPRRTAGASHAPRVSVHLGRRSARENRRPQAYVAERHTPRQLTAAIGILHRDHSSSAHSCNRHSS